MLAKCENGSLAWVMRLVRDATCTVPSTNIGTLGKHEHRRLQKNIWFDLLLKIYIFKECKHGIVLQIKKLIYLSNASSHQLCFHPKMQMKRMHKMGILHKTFVNKVSIQWVKVKIIISDKLVTSIEKKKGFASVDVTEGTLLFVSVYYFTIWRQVVCEETEIGVETFSTCGHQTASPLTRRGRKAQDIVSENNSRNIILQDIADKFQIYIYLP